MKKLLGIIVFCGSAAIIPMQECQLVPYATTPPIQVPQSKTGEPLTEDEIAAGSLDLLAQNRKGVILSLHEALKKLKEKRRRLAIEAHLQKRTFRPSPLRNGQNAQY